MGVIRHGDRKNAYISFILIYDEPVHGTVHVGVRTCNCTVYMGESTQRLYDMNGIFQMQGGKNRILPK